MNRIEINSEAFHTDILELNNINIQISGNNNLISLKGVIVSGFLNLSIIGDDNSIVIDDGTEIRRNTSICILPAIPYSQTCNGKIQIGKRNIFNGNGIDIVLGEKNTRIIIGDDCLISKNVQIHNSDGHKIYKYHQRVNQAKDIIVGDKVWIGQDSLLLKKTVINDGCVVGAKSLCNKEYPSKCALIAGVPAHIIDNDIEWSYQ